MAPQLAPQLSQTSRFSPTQAQSASEKISGYRVDAELPAAPSGPKPQEAQAWLAMAHRQAAEPAFTPFFPQKYSAGNEVRGQGMAITLKPVGSSSAQAQIENGKLVYHAAYAATDSLQVVSTGRSEEFLLLHDASAPQRFEYELTGVEGVKDVTLQKDGAVHFQNAKGQELQIEAPWLVESQPVAAVYDRRSVAPAALLSVDGHRPPLQGEGNAVHWELTPAKNGHAWPTLALVLNNPKGLHYPLVIDPTWTATPGQMVTDRINSTTTLLQNGKVLVVGGFHNPNVLSSAELYDPTTGAWTATGSMSTVRYSHAATLLPNGKVLVSGGFNGAVALTGSELYDPATGQWAATGSLHSTRYQHTSTLLANGQVLIVGGLDSNAIGQTATEVYNPANGSWTVTAGSLVSGVDGHCAVLLPSGLVLEAGGFGASYSAQAEIFNPANGTWNTVSNLAHARAGFTLTVLPNGKVLAAGGYGGSAFLTSAELFDPSNSSWLTTGQMNTGRSAHAATLLPNGRVLVTGGNSGGTDIVGTEIYDPSNGSWTNSTDMKVAREGHGSTLLANGQVLISGGDTGGTIPIAESELYDYAAGAWGDPGSLPDARDYHGAVLLPNGQVLIAGGQDPSGPVAESLLYNPATSKWTTTSGSLATARRFATLTLLANGKVLIAGGGDAFGSILTSAEIYDPGTGTWKGTGSLQQERYNASATLLPNGKVLVAGGNSYSGVVASAELYDPILGTWTTTGAMTHAREVHTATLLPNGLVLAAGGDNGASVLGTAELYNPSTGTWTDTGSLATGRQAHTADLLPNGKVLVAGGSTFGTTLSSAELYDPTAGTWSGTGAMNAQRHFHASTLLASGKVLVSGDYNTTASELYDPATGIWTVNGFTSYFRFAPTQTLLPNGKVLLVGGTHDSTTAAEIYDPGFGFTSATQPEVDALTSSTLVAGSALSLTGGGFTGTAVDNTQQGFVGPIEGFGGTEQSSPSNFPIVQLQSLVNEQVLTLPVDPTTGFSDSTFTSQAVIGFPPGYALLTVFVNGTPSVSQIVNVALKTQTITFPIFNGVYNQTVTLGATSDSGLPVTYSVVSGPATVDNTAGTVTFTGIGNVILAADQPGNATYAAAAQVQQKNSIGQAAQTIGAFATISDHTFGDAPFNITLPTSDSGLTVAVAVKSGNASISGNQITLTGAGPVILTADQAGNTNYTAASQVITSFGVAKGSQTIGAFAAISDHTFGDVPFTITLPTSDSGLTVAVTVKSGNASISGNQITITGVGPVTLAANQTGDTNYNAATEVTTGFNVTNSSQTIGAFATISDHTYGDAPFNITLPTSDSGLTVAVTVKSGNASISGNQVTITGVGLVTLAANQPGNTNVTAATEVTTSFNVAKASQTIAAFATIPGHTFGDSFFTFTPPTSNSGLTVAVTVKSGPAAISGNQILVTGAGLVTLAANQAGNSNYTAATEVTTSFNVAKASQTIGAFPTIHLHTYGNAPFTITFPTVNSYLTVAVTVKSGPATISGNRITLTGAGLVKLAANQSGDANHTAATEVTISFDVLKAAQTLTFPAIADQLYGATFSTGASASSGLPVTYTVFGHVRLSGDIVSVTGSGSAAIRAYQTGNANYLPATTIKRDFTITAAPQTITFPAISNRTFGDAPATLHATASSHRTITYSVLSGPASISGDKAVLTGAGTVQIAADQSGSDNFTPAPRVIITFQVGQAKQTITFPTIGNQTSSSGSITLNATSTSGLPITYSTLGPISVTGHILTILGPGSASIAANQDGNTNYAAATKVRQTFTIGN